MSGTVKCDELTADREACQNSAAFVVSEDTGQDHVVCSSHLSEVVQLCLEFDSAVVVTSVRS